MNSVQWAVPSDWCPADLIDPSVYQTIIEAINNDECVCSECVLKQVQKQSADHSTNLTIDQSDRYGGIPSINQHTRWPRCDCNQPMSFLLQLNCVINHSIDESVDEEDYQSDEQSLDRRLYTFVCLNDSCQSNNQSRVRVLRTNQPIESSSDQSIDQSVDQSHSLSNDHTINQQTIQPAAVSQPVDDWGMDDDWGADDDMKLEQLINKQTTKQPATPAISQPTTQSNNQSNTQSLNQTINKICTKAPMQIIKPFWIGFETTTESTHQPNVQKDKYEYENRLLKQYEQSINPANSQTVEQSDDDETKDLIDEDEENSVDDIFQTFKQSITQASNQTIARYQLNGQPMKCFSGEQAVVFNQTINQSVDQLSNQLSNQTITQSNDQKVDESSEHSFDQSNESSDEDSDDGSSVSESKHRSIKQPNNRPIKQFVVDCCSLCNHPRSFEFSLLPSSTIGMKLMNQSNSQASKQTTSQSSTQSTVQSADASTDQAINQSINQTINQFTQGPVDFTTCHVFTCSNATCQTITQSISQSNSKSFNETSQAVQEVVMLVIQ